MAWLDKKKEVNENLTEMFKGFITGDVERESLSEVYEELKGELDYVMEKNGFVLVDSEGNAPCAIEKAIDGVVKALKVIGGEDE